jgi:hypothetical protein
MGSIGVNMGQHPYGTLSTPCRVHARRIEAVLRAREGGGHGFLSLVRVALSSNFFGIWETPKDLTLE